MIGLSGWLHFYPKYFKIVIFAIFTYLVFLPIVFSLARGIYAPTIYIYPSLEFWNIISLLMPFKWKEITKIYIGLMSIFTFGTYYMEGYIPEGLLFAWGISPILFGVSKSYYWRMIKNMYKLMYGYQKHNEEMKRLFDAFPHGVIIHTDNEEDQKWFTNNHFKTQIQDIRNKIEELHSIQVKVPFNEDNFEENKGETNIENFSDFYSFLHQWVSETPSAGISEKHKVVIRSSPGQYWGNMLDLDEESRLEFNHESDGNATSDNTYSIKTLKVQWEGKSWWMHVLIDTSIIIKFEEAKNNIKCQQIMFASASHEFRTPLNAIMNSHHILKTHVDNIESLIKENSQVKIHSINNMFDAIITNFRSTLKLWTNSSLVLSCLVEDILDLNKLEAGTFSMNFSYFTANEIVKEIGEFFKDQWRQKNICLKICSNEDVNQALIHSDK